MPMPNQLLLNFGFLTIGFLSARRDPQITGDREGKGATGGVLTERVQDICPPIWRRVQGTSDRTWQPALSHRSTLYPTRYLEPGGASSRLPDLLLANRSGPLGYLKELWVIGEGFGPI